MKRRSKRMNFLDIIGMSAGNLWRRKLRTILTVSGVVIGTASIVIMLSLGIGLKTTMMEEMTSYGGMTEICVSEGWSGDSSTVTHLTDAAIADMEMLPNVTSVSPMLTLSGRFIQGKYSGWVQLQGVSQEYMTKLEVGEGTLPEADGSQLQLLVGNTVITGFYYTANNVYPYYEEGEIADVDLMNKTLFTQFDATGYTDSTGNYIEDPAKKNIFPVVGMLKGGPEDYTQYSNNVYADIDTLRNYIRKTYPGEKLIPGQPTDKNGKKLKQLTYGQAIVSVDESQNVETVLQSIKDMGFEANSEAEWIEQTEQELKIIQAVLGGIGAISLLVAAIGIANTMMMSTYERTKEIGVMKVLGCALGNIRGMFLTEAAFIGFLGGVVGVLLSCLLSLICNMVIPGLVGYEGSKISVIPIWLVLVAIVFSTLVGMIAGFFPAQRATKLSPLAAIRND